MIVRYYLKYVENYEDFVAPEVVTASWSHVDQWSVGNYSAGFIQWYERVVSDAQKAADDSIDEDYLKHFFALMTKQDSHNVFLCVRLDEFLYQYSFIRRLYNDYASGLSFQLFQIET